MKRKLLIVESYTKSKTIQKILGNSFLVISCNGHICDLIPKKNSIEFNNDKNLKMNYNVLETSKKIISNLKKEIPKTNILYLGTDSDREGEAISWHLIEELKKIININIPVFRIIFYEITKLPLKVFLSMPF